MIEQRRSIFDALLLQVIIPWLISVNWLWALRLARFWNREIAPDPAVSLLTQTAEAADPGLR